jgi:hypothetical protein
VGASLRQGDVGINSLNGPRNTTEDFGLLKTTMLYERYTIQFRAEAFNMWNHTVLGLPNFANAPFATPNTTITYVDKTPRLIQLALKLMF